jgi:hypothetical protein
MVIAASIVVPRYIAFQRSGQAKDTARNILAYLREAREFAIEKQRTVVVALNPDARVMQMQYNESAIPILQESDSIGGGSPEEPLFYPDAVLVQVQTDSSSQGPGSLGGNGNAQAPNEISFTPDGQTSDTNVTVLYSENQGYLVTVRRQGTELAIQSAQDAAMSSMQGGF